MIVTSLLFNKSANVTQSSNPIASSSLVTDTFARSSIVVSPFTVDTIALTFVPAAATSANVFLIASVKPVLWRFTTL